VGRVGRVSGGLVRFELAGFERASIDEDGDVFERYTEAARRALFFARMEVTQLGARSIDAEHLLLGLIREPTGPLARIFAESHVSLPALRHAIVSPLQDREDRERIPTPVEVPFSPDASRVLQYAAEEADRLMHSGIGTEHLLLGLLREERSRAASILVGQGVRLDDARAAIVMRTRELRPAREDASAIDVSEEIEQIRRLVHELARIAATGGDTGDVVDRIEIGLDLLKRHLAG
jgi:ATP-dependent Clp protease ATP-binding subunit ClpC